MSFFFSSTPTQTTSEADFPFPLRRVPKVITAVNDEGGEVNVARDSEGQDTIPNIAKRYKSHDQPWMLVVDDVSFPHPLSDLLLLSSSR